MRIVAIVGALTGALCVEEIVKQGDEVVAVVTDPSDPNPWMPPGWSVKEMADRYFLPVYQPFPKTINQPGFLDTIRKLHPDFLVAMHYGVIFKPPLLDIFPMGAVNIHPTRLPRGQGKTPSCWHMLMGDERNWITLHWIDPGIDTGDVIAQASVEITPDDTGHTSSCKLLLEGHRIFAENLPLLRAGKAPRIPQSQIPGVERLYYRWEPSFARIAWEKPAEQVALHVRALHHPKEIRTYSGEAYTHLAGQRVSVWGAQAWRPTWRVPADAVPGEILALLGEGVLVLTGQGCVVLTDIDVAGYATPGLPGLHELLRPNLRAVFE